MHKVQLIDGSHIEQFDVTKKQLSVIRDLLTGLDTPPNPIDLFIADAVLLDESGEVSKDDLYQVFKHWATKRSISPGSHVSFTRRFTSTTTNSRIWPMQRREKGVRHHYYSGIKLSPKFKQYLDSLSGEF